MESKYLTLIKFILRKRKANESEREGAAFSFYLFLLFIDITETPFLICINHSINPCLLPLGFKQLYQQKKSRNDIRVDIIP
jgi:hypothetical protein